MLSIGNVLPLRRILEGAVICNVKHHVSNRGTYAGASRDYAIMISRNTNNGNSTGASRDYAIVISRNPDNGIWTGAFPAEERPPWLMDVSDISSSFMNWPI